MKKIETTDTIKLDIDKKRIDYERFKLVTKTLKKHGLKINSVKAYKTNKGYHIYIKVENIAEMYLYFVQLLYGSDWKRELLNFDRYLQGIPNEENNILFSEKWEAKSKKSKEVFDIETTKKLLRLI